MNNLPLIVGVVIPVILIIFLLVYSAKEAEKHQERLDSIRQQERVNQQIILEKTRQELRQLEAIRRKTIKVHLSDWGMDICKQVYRREISLDMNQEMVLMSWGEPTSIDQKFVNSKSVKERWVYGIKRKNAKYIYFTNGKVTKIQT